MGLEEYRHKDHTLLCTIVNDRMRYYIAILEPSSHIIVLIMMHDGAFGDDAVVPIGIVYALCVCVCVCVCLLYLLFCICYVLRIIWCVCVCVYLVFTAV